MAESAKRIVVESEDSTGKKKRLVVILPNAKINKDAQLVYNQSFSSALKSGAILRQKLDQVMREQGIWDDVKQKEYDQIMVDINDNEKKLASGGIALSEAKAVAVEMRELREEFRGLISERTSMDGNTAEGQADNARFNYLVYACLLNQEGKRVFDSFEHYEEKADEPYVVKSAGALAEKLYGLAPDYESNLPENKFLQDYQFVDKDLRFVNDDGHLVDLEGRLIDEDGRFIKYEDDGNKVYIDIDGNVVTVEGEYKMDFSPFLDDTGEPVPVPEKEETAETESSEDAETNEEKPKPKKTRKKKVSAEIEVESQE
jgi:hypothetical protein